MRRKLIVGNWKMNKLREEAGGLAENLKRLLAEVHDVDIVVCPPYTALEAVSRVVDGTHIGLGAQNLFWEESGAFTGEVSPYMLLDAGCKWVIVGHSERRGILKETDGMIRRKIQAALNTGLIPIMCVCESLEERRKEETVNMVERQIREGLRGIEVESPERLTIAYEPIWAIGTGETAAPEQAEEVHAFIRRMLKELYGGDVGEGIRILYGGSVRPENAGELLSSPNIDGVLVGGASLEVDAFSKIVFEAGR